MKPKTLSAILKPFIFLAVVLFSMSSHAQLSTDENFAYGDQKKIIVDLKLSPSSKEFSARIVPADSALTKLKIWVCNAEGKRCTVNIANTNGVLWTTSFRDAYYNQVFDLSSLEDGDYSISISNGKTTMERRIVMNSTSYTVRKIAVN